MATRSRTSRSTSRSSSRPASRCGAPVSGSTGWPASSRSTTSPTSTPTRSGTASGPSDGWYKRPEIGVTDLAHKWRPADGSLGLGGGLTIGTVADNGFTFNGREVLVLVFPGPILMIEGKANILHERAKLSDEPIFRALAVLDGRAGTILFGLDAQYKEGSGGELLDIRGSAEGFFDFHDHDRWHIYLGLDDPKEKRIRAQLFKLFEADAYFMVDAHGLRTGAWVGYDKSWRYGPVKITLEAWLETAVTVNWKPTHYHGELWAHGKVKMKVFGFGFGMSLDAKLEGDVFDPFHILGGAVGRARPAVADTQRRTSTSSSSGARTRRRHPSRWS